MHYYYKQSELTTAWNFTLRCALLLDKSALCRKFLHLPSFLLRFFFSFNFICSVASLPQSFCQHKIPITHTHTRHAMQDDTNTFGKRMSNKAPARRGCYVSVTHLNFHRCFGFLFLFATMFGVMGACGGLCWLLPHQMKSEARNMCSKVDK